MITKKAFNLLGKNLEVGTCVYPSSGLTAIESNGRVYIRHWTGIEFPFPLECDGTFYIVTPNVKRQFPNRRDLRVPLKISMISESAIRATLK